MQLRLKELREDLCITMVSLSSRSKLKDIWEVRFGQKEFNKITERLS